MLGMNDIVKKLVGYVKKHPEAMVPFGDLFMENYTVEKEVTKDGINFKLKMFGETKQTFSVTKEDLLTILE